jgi:anti-anti-sigma regulatory factor
MDAGTKKLIVDFAEVPYIDSTGLGFLAGARVTVHNAQGQIVLTNLGPHVRNILDGVNLSQFFEIAPDETAAMTLLNSSAAANETQGKSGGKLPSSSSAAEV